MQRIDQYLFETMAKDQGDKFQTIIKLARTATDADWSIIMDQISYQAQQGLAYLKHFEDDDTRVGVDQNGNEVIENIQNVH